MPSESCKILCIDGYIDLCELLSLYFDQESFNAAWAPTLASGRRMIRFHEFALYIIDEEYLDGTGLDFIREVRATGSKIPIIYQSACAFPENIQEGLAAGASFYLVKPFKMQELVADIKLIINLTARAKAANRQSQL